MFIFTQKNRILILISIIFTGYLSGQSTQYFDEYYKPIRKATFKKKLRQQTYFEIPGDSAVHHKKLTPRLVQGVLPEKEEVLILLERATGKKIDREVPTVILYHPGKDKYNATGMSSQKYLKGKHQLLVKYLKEKANTTPIYIFKEHTGLTKYRGIMDWYKDPIRVIEKRFFKYHYPGRSFVVIGTDGTYISYKGEYAIDQVWEAAGELSIKK